MAKLLLDKHLRGACRRQRRLFRETFPDGAPLTMASIRTCKRVGLDWGWAERIPLLDRAAEVQAELRAKWYHYDVLSSRLPTYRAIKREWIRYMDAKAKIILAALRKSL